MVKPLSKGGLLKCAEVVLAAGRLCGLLRHEILGVNSHGLLALRVDPSYLALGFEISCVPFTLLVWHPVEGLAYLVSVSVLGVDCWCVLCRSEFHVAVEFDLGCVKVAYVLHHSRLGCLEGPRCDVRVIIASV